MKVRTADGGWVALAETLKPIADVVRPERRLLISSDGVRAAATYLAPAGWSLIDFTLHPSREISAVLATDTALRLVRLNAQGHLLASTELADPLAASDPFMSDPIYLRNPRSMVPNATRDAARLGSVGEEAALVLRTGRNAVLAYRFGFSADGGFRQAWRTLVEPGAMFGNLGLTSGTFDPFGGLDNQWRLVMDVDVNGRIAVAVGTYLTELAEGHAQYFNEPAHLDQAGIVLVTQIDANGKRIGTAVLEPFRKSEVHAVKWIGELVAVAGRVLTERRADGGGWDGYLALTKPATAQQQSFKLVDVDRGEVIFDIAQLAGGRMLVAGSAGYTQNPAGGSISEGAAPLLAVLDAQGNFVQRIAVEAGPRHNQLRSLTPLNGNWLAAGFDNGPGTHSADANAALLAADGYVRAIKVPTN